MASDGRSVISAPVVVNDVRRGNHEVVIVDDGTDVALDRVTLSAIGLDALAARAGQEDLLWLSEASDVVEWVIDENLVLVITASPSLLPVNVISSTTSLAPDVRIESSPAAFVNYALGGLGEDASVFLELGASRGRSRFEATGSWDGSAGARRGLTRYVMERRQRTDALVLGDEFVLATDPLGGSPVMGGVTWKRDFGIDPYFVSTPRLDFAGASTAPATAEIYVNGALVRSVPLPPGPFTLADLPVPAGPGVATVLVRDVFGNVQTYEDQYHFSPTLLAPGVNDFSYSVGAIRDSLTGEDGYGDLAVVARHRRGISQSLTLGGSAELSESTATFGASGSLVWRGFEAETGGAWSHAEGANGWGAYGSLYRRWRRAGIGINATLRSDEYATLTLRPGTDRTTEVVRVFIGTSIGLTSAIVSASDERTRDDQSRRSLSLNVSRPVGDRIAAFTRFGISSINNVSSNDISVGISMSVGRRRSLSASLGHGERGFGSSMTVQQAQPFGEGLAYRVSVQDTESASGNVSYDLPWVRAQLDVSTLARGNATGSLAGGVVWIDRGLRFTQPLTGAFGLAKVSDAAGVRVSVANQYVGRTDSNGTVFLPRLFPYYSNKVTIADVDVPGDYRVDQTELHVAPPRFGASVIEFPVNRITAFSGTIQVARGSDVLIPGYGEVSLTRDGKRVTSPVGGDGEFYFEGVRPADYEAEVAWRDGRCVFRLVVPQGLGAFGEVGTVVCREEGP